VIGGVGAQAIILGCTELPYAVNYEALGDKIIVSTDLLAEAVVDRYYSRCGPPHTEKSQTAQTTKPAVGAVLYTDTPNTEKTAALRGKLPRTGQAPLAE